MSLIPPQYLNAVVSIEVETLNQNGEKVIQPVATGFLLAKITPKTDESGHILYRIFLVTNRHVFEDAKTKKCLEEAYLRFNIGSENKAKYYKVNLTDKSGKIIWFRHKNENVDIAILSINVKLLQADGADISFFREAKDIFLARDFNEIGISTGDGLFVLGFPMGIRGDTKNFVIVRQGIIARVDEEVLKNHYFFIDASAYPGNSGGPVIHRPEMLSITGTKSNSNAGLIGVISQGVTYSDIAVSQQSGEAKVIFTEQTGLIKIVPIDSVMEAIDDFTKENRLDAEPEQVPEVKSEEKTGLNL